MKKYICLHFVMFLFIFSCSENNSVDTTDDDDTADVADTDDDDTGDDDDNDDDALNQECKIYDESPANKLAVGIRRNIVDKCSENLYYTDSTRKSYLGCEQNVYPDEYIDYKDCSKDSDCSQHSNGWCMFFNFCGGAGYSECFCVYDECFQDSDCPEGFACSCAYEKMGTDYSYSDRPINKCVPSECKSDEDCPCGQACMVAENLICDTPFSVEGAVSVSGYYCATPYDSCRTLLNCNKYDEGGYTGCWYGSRLDKQSEYVEHFFITDTDEPHWHCIRWTPCYEDDCE